MSFNFGIHCIIMLLLIYVSIGKHSIQHISLCDQAVLLKNGRTLDSGAPENVMTGAALTELYGGACSRGELAGGLPVVHPAF